MCIAPVTLTSEKGFRVLGKSERTITVPCGKCPDCKKKRIAQWVFRLQNEYQHSENGWFITCTYSDENLTYGDTRPLLYYPDHQNFLKRLRTYLTRKYNWKHKIKYYACGEYGDKGDRPHYHYILFNLPESLTTGNYNRDEKRTIYYELEHLWKMGYVDVQPANSNTMAYVASYVQKRAYQRRAEYTDITPERSFCSRGLGLNFITPEIKRHYRTTLTPYMTHADGEKLSWPRYYKDKIFTDEEKIEVGIKGKQFIEEKPELSDKDDFEVRKQKFQKAKRMEKLKRKTI